jgi:hypothetical protein
VVLILTALRHREKVPAQDRPKIPVPVLVTAQDWDPVRRPIGDWLARKLQETYPLFVGAVGATTAAALIATGRIAVILDGLDEIASNLQPLAMQAINQQASFRIVVLSRTAEMASAASRQGVLQGVAAIELQPISPAAAASYLERVQLDPPPAGWQELINRLRNDPTSLLGRALDSPLTLTLVRDTYQSGEDARELLEFCDAIPDDVAENQTVEAITDHLLDRVLPAAYAPRLGQPSPPYDLATAKNALIKIATRMNQEGTRDLQWWRIPEWAPFIERAVMVGLAVGLTFGLTFGLLYSFRLGLVFGLIGALSTGLLSIGGLRPSSIGKFQFRKALTWGNLALCLGTGLGFGFILGLGVGLADGLTTGLVAALMGMLLDAFPADPDSEGSQSPPTSWRNNLSFGLVLGLGAGLVITVTIGLIVGRTNGIGTGLALVVGLGIGLVGGLIAGFTSSEIWPVLLASTQLAIRWRTPVRLMSFLNDAHNRNVLRIVGPAYQFRHGRLQDRLAAAADRVERNTPA